MARTPLRSFRDLNPMLVGLGSVALIGLAVAFALAVGLLHLLEDTYTVKAVFPDAAGARNGDDVRVAGVQVGRITDIQADRQHGNVVITFVVNKGVDVAPDATAELALTTLLGTKFIRLGGTVPPDGPYLADLPADRRVIPIERTKIPFDIFELTSTATRSIEATDNEKLNDMIVSLADVTEGNADEIGRLLHGIDALSRAINERDADLRQLLDRADQLSGVLADKDQTLVELIDASQRVLDLVVSRRPDVAAGLRDASAFTGELARIIGVHKSFLDSLLDTVHPALEIVARHQETVDRALSWIGPGSLGLANAGGRGPWTDIYVRSLGPDFIAILGELNGAGG